jgi:hypothetical protein
MFKSIMLWVAVNIPVLAFFLFTGVLPEPLVTGVLVVFWIGTIAYLCIFAVGTFAALVADDISTFSETLDGMTNKPNWYYRMDTVYDLILIGTIGAAGYTALAVFYAATCLVYWFFRGSLILRDHQAKEETAGEQALKRLEAKIQAELDRLDREDAPEYTDLPEWMRDESL